MVTRVAARIGGWQSFAKSISDCSFPSQHIGLSSDLHFQTQALHRLWEPKQRQLLKNVGLLHVPLGRIASLQQVGKFHCSLVLLALDWKRLYHSSSRSGALGPPISPNEEPTRPDTAWVIGRLASPAALQNRNAANKDGRHAEKRRWRCGGYMLCTVLSTSELLVLFSDMYKPIVMSTSPGGRWRL